MEELWNLLPGEPWFWQALSFATTVLAFAAGFIGTCLAAVWALGRKIFSSLYDEKFEKRIKAYEADLAEKLKDHQATLDKELEDHKSDLDQKLAQHQAGIEKELSDHKTLRGRSLDLLFDAAIQSHKLASHAMETFERARRFPVDEPSYGQKMDEAVAEWSYHLGEYQPLWNDEMLEVSDQLLGTFLEVQAYLRQLERSTKFEALVIDEEMVHAVEEAFVAHVEAVQKVILAGDHGDSLLPQQPSSAESSSPPPGTPQPPEGR